jgi:hypothetical protein
MDDYNPRMNGFFAALGVAFAAFFMWLGVRILNRGERWAKRTAVGLACLVGLYVFSSGPMRLVACRRHVSHVTDSLDRVQAISHIDPGVWWPKVYAPLDWASDQPWGRPVDAYWRLFPAPFEDRQGRVEYETPW